MKCKHDLDGQVCLLCMYQTYTRAGWPMPEDVLLEASRVLQEWRDRSVEERTLNMNSMAWTLSALDKATEILRREGELLVRGLPGDDRIHCFFCENALREWSEEMLTPATV